MKLIPGIGTHSYKAEFAGTLSYSASVSSPSSVSVAGLYPSTTTLSSSGGAGNYTLTATVASSGLLIGPTGSVVFQDTSNSNYQLGSITL